MTRYHLSSAVRLLVMVVCCALPAAAQAVDRAQIEKEINDLYAQIGEKAKALLTVSPEDRETYAEYLHQPDKGVIRLLPREKFDLKLPIRGGGAYYSFTQLTHEYGWSDISLSRGEFSVGFAGFNFGLMFALGDLPLELATLETSAIKSLVEYQPPATESEIRAQNTERHKGIKIGAFTYITRLEAQVAKTYALRSWNFDNTDVLVAFRVIRADSDGSLTLLWKMLKRFPKPTAIREKLN